METFLGEKNILQVSSLPLKQSPIPALLNSSGISSQFRGRTLYEGTTRSQGSWFSSWWCWCLWPNCFTTLNSLADFCKIAVENLAEWVLETWVTDWALMLRVGIGGGPSGWCWTTWTLLILVTDQEPKTRSLGFGIVWIEPSQRSVWPSHNSSHSTLYPDVLKIKTIIVEKKNCSNMPLVYYLQIHFWQLCSLDVAERIPGTSWVQGCQIMAL